MQKKSLEVYRKRMLLVIGECQHLLYESGQGYHRTFCNIITKEGRITKLGITNCEQCKDKLKAVNPCRRIPHDCIVHPIKTGRLKRKYPKHQ